MTILLESLLSTGDFAAATAGLAREYRHRHALPPIHQLGLVVPDVEAAASRLEAQGIGPFFIAKGSPVLWRERGEERSVRGKLGLAHHQGFELELLEPLEGSDFYARSLDGEGRIVVQHLGFLVRHVDEWAERLAATGPQAWVRGRLKMGPMKVDFAYMDTFEEVGVIIEFICWRIFGVTFRPRSCVLTSAGRLEKWSGKRSLSV
jgi:hypothetical protein